MKKQRQGNTPLTKSQIDQLGKNLAQAIHCVIKQKEFKEYDVKKAIEIVATVVNERDKYYDYLEVLRADHQRDFAHSKNVYKEMTQNGNVAVKGIARILESYDAEFIIPLYRFLKELPSGTDCESVFKRIVAESNRRWGSPSYLVDNVLNGTKQSLVSKRTKAYKTMASAVKNARAKLGDRNRLLSLDGVVSVRDGNHYVAFVCGGNNGRSDWETYFDSLKAIVNALPRAWIVAVENDCLDDVHYALVGFRL